MPEQPVDIDDQSGAQKIHAPQEVIVLPDVRGLEGEMTIGRNIDSLVAAQLFSRKKIVRKQSGAALFAALDFLRRDRSQHPKPSEEKREHSDYAKVIARLRNCFLRTTKLVNYLPVGRDER